MAWLTLSLVCAISMASADAATKYWLSTYSAPELVVVRFGYSAILLAPLLLQPWPELPAPFWGWVGSMVPLEILAMWLYMKAIRDTPLYLTLPYLAFTPVFVAMTGLLLLGERISLTGWIGILLVVAGAYRLNAGRGTRLRAWFAPLRALAYARGSRLMLTVAVLYSLTSVMGKGALQYTSPLFFAPFYFCLLGLATLLLFGLVIPQPRALLRAHLPQHLAVGALMALMIVTHFAAVERAEVAYMIAVKRTSLLFGILYGTFLFKEPYPLRHLVAGALMVCGVLLIALGHA
ncbi:MAG: DMT family transporter [Gammaproteobacteria bacterium]